MIGVPVIRTIEPYFLTVSNVSLISLSQNMRSRTSMISVTSGEESPFVTGGATPPPLPSRKTEVLPDPQALIRDRRSAANANAPDTPALPPKVRLFTPLCRAVVILYSDLILIVRQLLNAF